MKKLFLLLFSLVSISFAFSQEVTFETIKQDTLYRYVFVEHHDDPDSVYVHELVEIQYLMKSNNQTVTSTQKFINVIDGWEIPEDRKYAIDHLGARHNPDQKIFYISKNGNMYTENIRRYSNWMFKQTDIEKTYWVRYNKETQLFDYGTKILSEQTKIPWVKSIISVVLLIIGCMIMIIFLEDLPLNKWKSWLGIVVVGIIINMIFGIALWLMFGSIEESYSANEKIIFWFARLLLLISPKIILSIREIILQKQVN